MTHDKSFVCAKYATDAKCVVLTLVKIKYGAPITVLKPHIIDFSRLEQMCVDLTEEQMEAHGSAGGSCEFCTKFGVTLLHDVQKAIHSRTEQSKI